MTVFAERVLLKVRCGDCGYAFSLVDPKDKERLMVELLAGTRCPTCGARATVVTDAR